jgi:hypothetical protein
MSRELLDILAGLEPEELEDIGDVRMYPVESSNLAAVGYNKDAFELTIAFLDGSIYRYEAVPMEEYVDLMKADSKGEYFYTDIRLIYEFERIAG